MYALFVQCFQACGIVNDVVPIVSQVSSLGPLEKTVYLNAGTVDRATTLEFVLCSLLVEMHVCSLKLTFIDDSGPEQFVM